MPQLLASSPKVLLFDVNETLLDLKPLKNEIDQILSQEGISTLWFATMLHYSLMMTAGGQHAPLPEIGAAVLQMLAKNQHIVLSGEDAKKVLKPMLTLPPHADVRPALERLKEAGFHLAALTNSTQSGMKSQLEHAGIADCFDEQLSVEGISRYKPHREVYLWAAQQVKVKPEECMLIAAHGWDVAGATWAGMMTAFVSRPGQQVFPLAPRPELLVADLSELATRLGA